MKVEAAERPRLLIVAGPNGAGKTTITEAGLAHQWFAGCEYVNPDEIATERREACLREGRSLAFETVFSSPEKVISFTAPLRQGSSGDFFSWEQTAPKSTPPASRIECYTAATRYRCES